MLARQRQARETALAFYNETLRSIGQLVMELREWNYDHAELLALEAKYMVESLQNDPGFVAARWIRIQIWRKRYRKHRARAWASNAVIADACGLHGVV